MKPKKHVPVPRAARPMSKDQHDDYLAATDAAMRSEFERQARRPAPPKDTPDSGRRGT